MSAAARSGPFLPPVPAAGDGAGGAGEMLSAVVMMPWGPDEWALVVQPGSDSADLMRAVSRMPGGLKYSESFGDVDVVLVYRLPDGDSAAAGVGGEDPGPSRRGCGGAAVRTALALGLTRPDSRWMTRGERAAFRAGQAEAFEAVRRTVLDAIGVPVASTTAPG
ncbi:hypothetical protein E0F15_03400 [Frankia sp. B2]|uniref:hypothetical protein n=1 Tax=Frankia TaxID=1854 RepID=UPI00055AE0C5|nr:MULTISPECIES: hypothetical protein [Frankia]OFB43062.1 hypothetical protein Manayef4_13355 [Frankia sp. CgIM4]OHV54022.1 hypothetical protein CgIS1_13025 [Frankia sp. CgIS1]TFE34448.1 hypothetical protein E0F15_03400 [Frankia sp. B2]ORT48429.1 hypothetical protein KBI5_15830 [Frankia sp. KB5]ORT94467.1 hypothetical protein UK99_16290 [Frankia casuarinae]